MIFCPKCGAMLVPDPETKKIKCSCGYKETKTKNIVVREKINGKEKLEIIDKSVEVLPKTKMECPKCGNAMAYYWLAQTRSSDEPETQFFRCVKCDHQWRVY